MFFKSYSKMLLKLLLTRSRTVHMIDVSDGFQFVISILQKFISAVMLFMESESYLCNVNDGCYFVSKMSPNASTVDLPPPHYTFR